MNQKNYRTCKLIKIQVDELLHEMAVLFTNLGTDSTQEEIDRAYRLEYKLIDKIAEIDPNKAMSIRPYEN
tara:strand:- start:1044 stop:1253 length:210 start_codon:yes stop_codon:yes gene_type:complete